MSYLFGGNKQRHVNRLNHKDPKVRLKAIQKLSKWSDLETIEFLIKKISDTDKSVQNAAKEILSVPSFVPTLMSIKVESDERLRHRIAKVLVDLAKLNNNRAILALIMMRQVAWIFGSVKDESYILATRDMVNNTLSEIGVERVFSLAIDSLKDMNSIVRSWAIEALERIGDTRAVSALNEILRDEDEAVVNRAINALISLGDARDAVPILTEKLRDEDEAVVFSAVYKLGKIDDPQVKLLLIDMLDHRCQHIRNNSTDILKKLGYKNDVAIRQSEIQDTIDMLIKKKLDSKYHRLISWNHYRDVLNYGYNFEVKIEHYLEEVRGREETSRKASQSLEF